MSVSRLLTGCCVVVVIAMAGLTHAGTDDVATRLGFSAGAAPLVVTVANNGSLSARGCGSCHSAQYTDWSSTRHSVAWSNAVFVDGLKREPLPRCVHCHAPLLQQKVEAGPLGAGRPRPPSSSLTAAAQATSLLHEGVTCVVCHVRDGQVLVAGPVTRADNTPMHPVRIEPILKDSQFCASCHQFGFTDSNVLMQNTFGEWQAFAAGGGVGTCQSCHMPGGRHLFRGAWDVELLKKSLQVEVHEDVDSSVVGARVLVLRSVDVGHHFPTGDLFRHLTVEVADGDGWLELLRIGRTFAGFGHDKHVVSDTSLVPGVPVRVALPRGATSAWRVRYHYAEARHEAAGVVDAVVIAAGP